MKQIPKNPYATIQKNAPEWIRVSHDIDRNDLFAIRSVVMDAGFCNSVLCALIKHLADKVRAENLTLNDRDKLITYVEQLISGRTNHLERPNGDDGRRAKNLRRRSPSTQDESAVGLREPAKAQEDEHGGVHSHD